MEHYNKIYQVTKKLPGLRKVIYLIREIGLFFPHRKPFFIKHQVPKKILNKLKLKIQGSEIIKEFACLNNPENIE